MKMNMILQYELRAIEMFFFQFIESEAWAENEESIGDLIQ